MTWQVRPLGELCEVLDNKREPITKRDRIAGGYPYYGATGILDYVASYIFDEDLVLLGEDGAKWGAGEKSAFIAGGKYWVNNHAHVLRPLKDRLDQQWLVYFLNFEDLMPLVSGLTVPKLNQGSMREIQVPIPPIAEQQRIVAILDEAFAGIATAKANAEKNLQNAGDALESYLESIFAVRLAGWSDRKLETVCTEITVGHVGPMRNEYVADGVPFLRSQNVRPFAISLENLVFIRQAFNSKIAKSRLRPGDIAIVRTGYPGTAAVIPDDLPEANCSDLVIMRPGPDVNPHFLVAFFNSAFGKGVVLGNLVGAAQKHFNVGAAKNVNLHMPPMPEQRQIVERIDEVRAEVARLESIYTRKLAALDELKQSLLHQAFSGQLS